MAPKAVLLAAGKAAAAAGAVSWMASQEARLEAQRAAFSFPPTEQDLAGAAFLPADAARPAEADALQQTGAEAARGFNAATRLLHRRSDAGLLKPSFEPQRHSVIVAGRPVQVVGYERQSTLQSPLFFLSSMSKTFVV